MDDHRNDESSDDSSSIGSADRDGLKNGFFGIEENNVNIVHSDCNGDMEMESVDHSTIIVDNITRSNVTTSNHSEIISTPMSISENNGESSCKNVDTNNAKKMDDENNVIILEDANNKTNIEEAENNSFSSHILDSKSTDADRSALTPSFASISTNFEHSRNEDTTKKSMLSPKDPNHLASESNSESTVAIPKGNLASILSMISTNYQDATSSDDCTSSSSDSDETDDNVDDDISICSDSSNKLKGFDDVKTKGELTISDLPPIEDLKISVDERKCRPIGCIKNIVDTLVIIEGFFDEPALDIDSVLFIDRGQRALGRIFDVFGPVPKPFYAVRFNDSDHIKNFNINIKEPVYCAPNTEYANYVMVSQLMQMKGSDASWKDNNEPPEEMLDYSDDEAERSAKQKLKLQKKNRKNLNGNDDNEDDDDNDENNDDDNDDDDVVVENVNETYPSAKVRRNRLRKKRKINTIQKLNSNHSNYTQQTYSPRPFNHTFQPCHQTPQPPNQNPCPPNLDSRPPNHDSRPPNHDSRPQYNDSRPQYNDSHSQYNGSNPQFNDSRPPNINSCPPNYGPRPPNHDPNSSNYGFGPRQFPTYAQHLGAVNYSHSYQQPYNPWYYNQTYPPSHGHPNQQHSYPPPRYDFPPPPPPNQQGPNQFHYPTPNYPK